MEELTNIQSELLAVIDAKLKKVNKVLQKAEPWIQERDRLMTVRRVLLAEKSSTGGAGNSRTRLTMEEVVTAMRAIGKPATAVQIAEKLGLEQTTVRSHLHRNKGERYEQDGNKWYLAEDEDEDEEDDD